MVTYFEVEVHLNGKVQSKEFENRLQFDDFMKKAEELKKKAPALLVKVTKDVPYDPREDSLAFEPIYSKYTGKRCIGPKGNWSFHCVKVPAKPGVLFCTECHTYKKFIKNELMGKVCETCGISTNDFYVKTANGLWKGSYS